MKNVGNGGVDHEVTGGSTRRRLCEVRRDHPARVRDAPGDRGPTGAMNRRNGRGARGTRKMDT